MRLRAWQAGVLVAIAFAVSGLSALAWGVALGRYGHRVSAWLLFRLSVIAFAIGWLVPSGFVAGIPVAAYVLQRRGVPLTRGLATFLIGRFFELAASALVLPAILFTGAGTSVPLRAGVVATMSAVVVACLDLTLGWRLGRGMLRALWSHAPRFLRSVLARAIDFCTTVAVFFESPAPAILAVAGLSALAIGGSFLRALLTAHFLAVGLTVPEVTLVFALTLLLFAVPFVPGGIGVYEGGIGGVFHLLGRSQAEGIAYAMTVHAVEMVVVAAGLAFLAELGVDLARVPESATRPTP